MIAQKIQEKLEEIKGSDKMNVFEQRGWLKALLWMSDLLRSSDSQNGHKKMKGKKEG